ncbi:MAG: CO dehydrogenase/CO-methylating acetyl-CoA synthase complex subunit beta [Candidatus Helarchaeota archaeon]|nr:CO dehydrogenase/CO-methylating acetyl-CoA synthase complex subunit beta [Candidatus Helarchaeota archaeon]
MWDDIPVDVGLVYEGERIRGKQMQVELGGPKITEKFELVQARKMNQIEDEKVTVIGPDLQSMEVGGRYPLGILVEVAGKLVEKDLEAVLERRIHEFTNFIEGMMHLNQRYDIWLRLSQGSYKKGFNTLQFMGKVLIRLYKTEFKSIIEKIQVTLYTDPKKIKPLFEDAKGIYEARDARARGMKDEEVDAFYGCTLCQSFAPTHVCTISPNRISLCGAINWFDARAAAKVDPKGPNFMIEKGELLDTVKGEYTGINEATKKKSLGEIEKVHMHTILSPYNHTSCGCFESIAFFIPEVQGIGIADRNFKGNAVNGLPFSTLANSTGGGKQVEGFIGMAIEYMRSPKFFQADGGWKRIVWLPASVKENVKDAIPPELYDKIATEQDVQDIAKLKDFLKSKGHPVQEYWTEEVEEVEEEEFAEAAMPMMQMPAQMPQMAGGMIQLPMMGAVQFPAGALGAAGGAKWKIVLKNTKIFAEEMIIKRIEEKPKKKK